MRYSLTAILILMFMTVSLAQWTKVEVGTDASFRGLAVVSKSVIWASGTGGTVIRSVDGGKNWSVFKVPGAEKLDFRDIEAFGKKTAYVLSIGNGDASRIYKTSDGGKTWKLQFTNTIEKAFFDSIAFWDKKNGIAQSDPVEGKYVFYRTTDGETWNRMDPDDLPAAIEGEAAFAASGTCIITRGRNDAFLITGGKKARVYHTRNRGKSWQDYEAPMISGGDATGIFGIAMRGERGILVGGEYTKPKNTEGNLALSLDGGKTWKRPAVSPAFGYRSGAAFVDSSTIIVVGISGSDISRNGGESWTQLDTVERNSVAARGKNAIWAVGPKGEVSKLTIE